MRHRFSPECSPLMNSFSLITEISTFLFYYSHSHFFNFNTMNQILDLKTLTDEWLKGKQNTVKPTTLAAYSLSIERNILPYFEKISDLDGESLQTFIDKCLDEGMSVKRLRDIMSVIKMVMNFAVERSYSDKINFNFRLPKDYKHENLKVFSALHLKKLVTFLLNEKTLRNLGIFICINTGMRIGEICGLKWGDVDLASDSITVNKTLCRIYNIGATNNKRSELILTTPKTRHSFRSIPLTQSLKDYIKMLHPTLEKENYVLTDSLRPIEPRTLRNYYYKILRDIGLPNMKFHALRHSFATQCIECKCDYKTLSSILGHSNISTTLHFYMHPSQEQKKRCIENVMQRFIDQ